MERIENIQYKLPPKQTMCALCSAEPTTHVIASVPRLDNELDIVARTQLNRSLSFGKVEENLLNHVRPFDEPKRLLHRTHHTTILDGMHRIFQANVTRAQIAPLIGRNLKANFVAGAQRHVALHVILVVRQEEAFTAILVANAARRRFAAGARRRVVRLDLGGHGARHAVFGEHHFGCDLGHLAGNRFAGAPIVGHLKLDGIADFQVLNVSADLREMEEETRLTVATLNEAVRVLL